MVVLVLFTMSMHCQSHCLTHGRHSYICEKKEGKEKEKEESYKFKFEFFLCNSQK